MKSMLVFLKAKYCGAKPWRLRLCKWVVEGLGAGEMPGSAKAGSDIWLQPINPLTGHDRGPSGQALPEEPSSEDPGSDGETQAQVQTLL